MGFDKARIRILVRKDYGACYDFYTEKLGLVPNWGDRNGPFTSFSTKDGEDAYLAIFAGANMSMHKDYVQPCTTAQPDTVVITVHSENVDEDYNRLKKAGVEFIGEPRTIKEWELRGVYFRDPEGNLIELYGDI